MTASHEPVACTLTTKDAAGQVVEWSNLVRVRMLVSGRVQGVGFRVSCARKAESLGLAGSVRNMSDGTVEVIAEGEADAVDAMTQWCQTGPSYAQVRAVECVSEPPLGETTFQISF